MILRITSFANIFKLILILLLALVILPFSRVKSLYFFLKLSGPTFIKLGQLLATRPDLIGEEMAKKLAVFQDKMPPFSCKVAHQIIKKEFHQDHKNLFLEFSEKPIASASIAQVYKCKTKDHEDVAVKILRPNIISIVRRDIFTLRIIVKIIACFSKYNAEKIVDVIELLEFCAAHELDLLNEAAAGSALADNLTGSNGIYVPKIHFELSTNKILTMEWIEGIPFSDQKRIGKSKINKIKAAENLVVGYLNQVYRDGLFHADMHPGNLFLLPDARIAIVDFGIIGIIDQKTRIAIAKILIAFLNRDYEAVAKLHIEAGLISKEVNVTEFALNCRIIGETIVGKSVNNISFADLLSKLLQMTRRYNMKTKPELLLLQKTIMLVEGVGVSLNKDLNIWDLSRPWIKEWAKTNIGFDAQIRDYFCNLADRLKNWPELIENNLEVRGNKEYLLTEIKALKKREASWKFFGLIFFSLWLISILSRSNIFN